MKQRIKTGTYRFHEKYWKDISEEAKDVSVSKRMNACCLTSWVLVPLAINVWPVRLLALIAYTLFTR